MHLFIFCLKKHLTTQPFTFSFKVEAAVFSLFHVCPSPFSVPASAPPTPIIFRARPPL